MSLPTVYTDLIIDISHPNPDMVVYATKSDRVRALRITMLNNGVAYEPSLDSTGRLWGVYYKNETTGETGSKIVSTEPSISGNVLTFDLDSVTFSTGICDVAGTYYVVVTLTDHYGEIAICLPPFRVVVADNYA